MSRTIWSFEKEVRSTQGLQWSPVASLSPALDDERRLRLIGKVEERGELAGAHRSDQDIGLVLEDELLRFLLRHGRFVRRVLAQDLDLAPGNLAAIIRDRHGERIGNLVGNRHIRAGRERQHQADLDGIGGERRYRRERQADGRRGGDTMRELHLESPWFRRLLMGGAARSVRYDALRRSYSGSRLRTIR